MDINILIDIEAGERIINAPVAEMSAEQVRNLYFVILALRVVLAVMPVGPREGLIQHLTLFRAIYNQTLVDRRPAIAREPELEQAIAAVEVLGENRRRAELDEMPQELRAAVAAELNEHILEQPGRIVPEDLLAPVNLDSLDPDDRDCNICLEPLAETDSDGHSHLPVRLRCSPGHVFGRYCITNHLSRYGTGCPLCREGFAQDLGEGPEADIDWENFGD